MLSYHSLTFTFIATITYLVAFNYRGFRWTRPLAKKKIIWRGCNHKKTKISYLICWNTWKESSDSKRDWCRTYKLINRCLRYCHKSVNFQTKACNICALLWINIIRKCKTLSRWIQCRRNINCTWNCISVKRSLR